MGHDGSPGHRESQLLIGALGADVLAMAVLAHDPAWWYGFVGTVLVACVLLVLLWRRNAVSTRQVVALGVAFRIAFLPLPPVLSDDAYRYVWDGLLQVEGINPYAFRPEEAALAAFQQEAIFDRLNSASYYSVYPPLSQLVFAFGGLFYEWGWAASYYVIKGLFAALEMTGVLLLARMVDARNLMLYAWHPLAIVESAGQGHTEAAAVLFLIAAIWGVHRSSAVGASLALAAAGLVKLYPFVLFPLLWRRFGWRAVWPGAALTAVVCLPYASWEALRHFVESLQLYVQLFEFNAGLYYGVKEVFWWVTGQDWSKTLGPALGGMFAASLLAIYRIDARRRWSFTRSTFWTLGAFFLCSTTVHPWYLLVILPLAVLASAPVWGWLWLGAGSVGTYLFYVDGPYWSIVALGWGGAALIALWQYGDAALQALMRRRAARKAQRVRPALKAFTRRTKPLRVLDLGAGEGYVGAHLQREIDAEVVLADVVDLNRTSLPHVVYDGTTLPWEDNRFDVTLLYFVLHHCEDPRRVLREALRVSRDGVVVVESTYTSAWQRRFLRAADRFANRLRSGGVMGAQEEHLRFRRPEAWRAEMEAAGAEIVVEERFGSRLHPHVLFAVRCGNVMRET